VRFKWNPHTSLAIIAGPVFEFSLKAAYDK